MKKSKFINYLVYVLTFLFFFKTVCMQYFSSFSIVESIFIVGKIVASLLIFMRFFTKNYPILKISKYILATFAFEVAILVTRILYKGYTFRAVIDLVTIRSLTMFIIDEIKNNKKMFFNCFGNYMFFAVLLNLISEIMFPSGIQADLYKNSFNPLFFMTVDNGSACLVCLALTLIFFNKELN